MESQEFIRKLRDKNQSAEDDDYCEQFQSIKNNGSKDELKSSKLLKVLMK